MIPERSILVNISVYTILFLSVLAYAVSAGVSLARDDADGHIYTRYVTISKCGIDKMCRRYIIVRARRTVFMPLVPTLFIRVRIPCDTLYEIVRTHGKLNAEAKYVRKRVGFIVTDEYLSLTVIGGVYNNYVLQREY